MPTMTLVAGSNLSGKLPSYSCRLSLENQSHGAVEKCQYGVFIKRKKKQ